jgi:hypothetical protein
MGTEPEPVVVVVVVLRTVVVVNDNDAKFGSRSPLLPPPWLRSGGGPLPMLLLLLLDEDELNLRAANIPICFVGALRTAVCLAHESLSRGFSWVVAVYCQVHPGHSAILPSTAK